MYVLIILSGIFTEALYDSEKETEAHLRPINVIEASLRWGPSYGKEGMNTEWWKRVVSYQPRDWTCLVSSSEKECMKLMNPMLLEIHSPTFLFRLLWGQAKVCLLILRMGTMALWGRNGVTLAGWPLVLFGGPKFSYHGAHLLLIMNCTSGMRSPYSCTIIDKICVLSGLCN